MTPRVRWPSGREAAHAAWSRRSRRHDTGVRGPSGRQAAHAESGADGRCARATRRGPSDGRPPMPRGRSRRRSSARIGGGAAERLRDRPAACRGKPGLSFGGAGRVRSRGRRRRMSVDLRRIDVCKDFVDSLEPAPFHGAGWRGCLGAKRSRQATIGGYANGSGRRNGHRRRGTNESQRHQRLHPDRTVDGGRHHRHHHRHRGAGADARPHVRQRGLRHRIAAGPSTAPRRRSRPVAAAASTRRASPCWRRRRRWAGATASSGPTSPRTRP